MTAAEITLAKTDKGSYTLNRGAAIIAFVCPHRDALGNLRGWKIIPQGFGRRPSRKTWLTPDNAIASMRYMTNSEARAAIARADDLRKREREG